MLIYRVKKQWEHNSSSSDFEGFTTSDIEDYDKIDEIRSNISIYPVSMPTSSNLENELCNTRGNSSNKSTLHSGTFPKIQV